VSKQTLYRYYQSKEDLFADILQQLTHQRTWRAVSAERLFESRAVLAQTLTELAQALVASLMHPTYLALLRVMLAEMPHIPQIAPLFRSTVPQRGIADLLTLFQRAHEAGLIALPDPELAVRLFVGPLLTYVITDGLFASDGVPHSPTPERIAEIVQLFLQAMP
jgi:AcrR family transcriptional regulator